MLNNKICFVEGQPMPPEDGLWLAASLTPKPTDTILDAGCGSGIISLALLHHCPSVKITGVETNPETARLAILQKDINAAEHWQIIQTDIVQHLPPKPYDIIFCNPPFHNAKGSPSNKPSKALAHHAEDVLLENWLTHFIKISTPTATFALMLHANQQAQLTSLCNKLSLHGTAYPLESSPHKPPKRLLVHLYKGVGSLATAPVITTYDPQLREDILKHGHALKLPA